MFRARDHTAPRRRMSSIWQPGIIIAYYVIKLGLLWISLGVEQRILITPNINRCYFFILYSVTMTIGGYSLFGAILYQETLKDSDSELILPSDLSQLRLIWSWRDNKASFQSSKDRDFNGRDLQQTKVDLFSVLKSV